MYYCDFCNESFEGSRPERDSDGILYCEQCDQPVWWVENSHEAPGHESTALFAWLDNYAIQKGKDTAILLRQNDNLVWEYAGDVFLSTEDGKYIWVVGLPTIYDPETDTDLNVIGKFTWADREGFGKAVKLLWENRHSA